MRDALEDLLRAEALGPRDIVTAGDIRCLRAGRVHDGSHHVVDGDGVGPCLEPTRQHHERESHREILVHCRDNEVTLPGDFLARGVYLATMYENLDRLDVVVNAQRCFEDVLGRWEIRRARQARCDRGAAGRRSPKWPAAPPVQALRASCATSRCPTPSRSRICTRTRKGSSGSPSAP